MGHTKSRLDKVGYFRRLTTMNDEIDGSIPPLLRLSRETIERCRKTEYVLAAAEGQSQAAENSAGRGPDHSAEPHYSRMPDRRRDIKEQGGMRRLAGLGKPRMRTVISLLWEWSRLR